MPRKMRRAALRSALSVKASDQAILVLDEISISEPKTREMAQVKEKLAGDSSALLIIPEKNEKYDMLHRAANNLPDLKLLMANYMNIRDLLGYDKVIIPLAALDIIESYLG
jgi:large subunit ribosomal protein L4